MTSHGDEQCNSLITKLIENRPIDPFDKPGAMVILTGLDRLAPTSGQDRSVAIERAWEEIRTAAEQCMMALAIANREHKASKRERIRDRLKDLLGQRIDGARLCERESRKTEQSGVDDIEDPLVIAVGYGASLLGIEREVSKLSAEEVSMAAQAALEAEFPVALHGGAGGRPKGGPLQDFVNTLHKVCSAFKGKSVSFSRDKYQDPSGPFFEIVREALIVEEIVRANRDDTGSQASRDFLVGRIGATRSDSEPETDENTGENGLSSTKRSDHGIEKLIRQAQRESRQG